MTALLLLLRDDHHVHAVNMFSKPVGMKNVKKKKKMLLKHEYFKHVAYAHGDFVFYLSFNSNDDLAFWVSFKSIYIKLRWWKGHN